MIVIFGLAILRATFGSAIGEKIAYDLAELIDNNNKK